MAQEESHKIQRPLPGKQNTLLRQNLEAPNPIESPVPERRGNLKNPDTQQFPVEGLVPDNRSPQNSSVDQKPYNRGQITRRDDDNTKDINLVPEIGDILLFKNNFYEIDSKVENQLILGKDPDYAISTGTTDFGSSHSIILTGHLSRVEKLNLIPLRGGKYPTTNKITDGTANLYDI